MHVIVTRRTAFIVDLCMTARALSMGVGYKAYLEGPLSLTFVTMTKKMITISKKTYRYSKYLGSIHTLHMQTL